jgi:hypothetical protein
MANVNRDQISALYFGLFNSSSSMSHSQVYKLTPGELSIDRSDSYWSARFTKSGYIFSGTKLELGQEKRDELSLLMAKVPSRDF